MRQPRLKIRGDIITKLLSLNTLFCLSPPSYFPTIIYFFNTYSDESLLSPAQRPEGAHGCRGERRISCKFFQYPSIKMYEAWEEPLELFLHSLKGEVEIKRRSEEGELRVYVNVPLFCSSSACILKQKGRARARFFSTPAAWRLGKKNFLHYIINVNAVLGYFDVMLK